MMPLPDDLTSNPTKVYIRVEDWDATYVYSGECEFPVFYPSGVPCLIISATHFSVLTSYDVDKNSLILQLEQYVPRGPQDLLAPLQHTGVPQADMQQGLITAFRLTRIELLEVIT